MRGHQVVYLRIKLHGAQSLIHWRDCVPPSVGTFNQKIAFKLRRRQYAHGHFASGTGQIHTAQGDIWLTALWQTMTARILRIA
jgi:hypothetical protein